MHELCFLTLALVLWLSNNF